MKSPAEHSAGKGKTVRFAEVVKSAGKPEVVTLWQAPDKDPRVRKARKENRIMTVTQDVTGSKKDFGMIGFELEPNASYLLFPKTLQPFEGSRVVGIKYEMLGASKPVGGVYKPSERRDVAEKQKDQPAAPPSPKTYGVGVRCTATLEVFLEVEAENSKAARNEALARVEREQLDFAKADKKFAVRKVSEKSG